MITKARPFALSLAERSAKTRRYMVQIREDGPDQIKVIYEPGYLDELRFSDGGINGNEPLVNKYRSFCGN